MQPEHDLDQQRAAADQHAEVEAEQADDVIIDVRSVCRISTRRSERPLARAVRT